MYILPLQLACKVHCNCFTNAEKNGDKMKKRRGAFSKSLSCCDVRFPCEQFKLKTNANDPAHWELFV